MFARARGLDLEGGVSKARDFRYASRRSNHRLKKTRAQRDVARLPGLTLRLPFTGVALGAPLRALRISLLSIHGCGSMSGYIQAKH
jgi:hypothetical protein